MMMMEYGSQFTTGSTLSSDTMSGSGDSVQPRVRTIRMVRPSTGNTLPPPGLTARHGPNLGFCVRGGREHGTGFFVSAIEPGSESHRQGLRVGDQIIRINGFTIEDAVHKEVLQLISNHTHLTLKVRSVGMIPVKERSSDPLSWQIITDGNSSTRSSPQLSDKFQEVRINIMVAPRTKLGCGICKGPDWKPGIFVQFTKEGGIAREAGLRPGDQILFCNGVDFSDIQFNEAVNFMKSSRQLEMVIRKLAGSELFPGESSGYNSSASSVTGDQSPSWADSRRLSIVKEESWDLEDRLTQLDRIKSAKWEKIDWDDGDDDKTLKNHQPFKPTIINLSESGTTITHNGRDSDNNTLTRSNNNGSSAGKLADIRMISRQQETKTVVVEVHRSNQEEKTEEPGQSASVCSFNSRSSDTSSSLSSAISQELQRRNERRKQRDKPTIDEQLQKKKILKGVDTEKQQHHSKLMDEFKKMHRKMFKTEEEQEDSSSGDVEIRQDITKDRQLDRQKLMQRRSFQPPNEAPKETNSHRHTFTGGSTNLPPPPPPLPANEIQSNGGENQQSPQNTPTQQNGTPSKTKPKAPPVPVKYSTLSHEKREFLQPPPCPTPDYDSLSLSSNGTTLPKQKPPPPPPHPSQPNGDSVEMDSIESYRLNHPDSNSRNVVPPSTYFNRAKKSLSAQLSYDSVSSSSPPPRIQRQVSVTIGEYPSGSLRRQPGKLDFLHGRDEADKGREKSISAQFANELANTLSRSNLRKRTESMENLLNARQIKSQTNGCVTISVNNNGLSKSLAKSTEVLSKCVEPSNRVTINIAPTEQERIKADPPNGILKNGNGNHTFHHNSHKHLVQQKSITFGEIPTVINDKLLHVT